MARKNDKNKEQKKMGRPPKDINLEQLEQLCKIQCTKEEICFVFRCDTRTIDRYCQEHAGTTFNKFYAEHRAEGFTSLRRAQYLNAMDGNTQMQIWLGKQYLNQTDKKDVDINGKLVNEIIVTIEGDEEKQLEGDTENVLLGEYEVIEEEEDEL